MPMLPVIIVLAAIYGLLTYFALPRFEKKWRESSRFAAISRAGSLAALKTVQSFTKLALIIFLAAFVVLGLLSAIAPLLGGRALIAVHSALGDVLGALRDSKAYVSNGLLLLALTGLAFFAWRVRTRGFRGLLAAERERQIAELEAKRAEGTLELLDPTPEMEELLKRFAELDFLAQSNPVAEGLTPEQIQAAISAEQNLLAANYLTLDYERRIDLTAMPLAEAQPSGWPGKLRLFLFSRGTTEGLGWLAKNLGRAATVITCLLMIGVSAPALARLGIQPMLAHLTDVQVNRNEKDALESLRQIARQASESADPEADTPEARMAYHAAAQHFVNAVARSNAWTTSSARILPDRSELAVVSHASDVVEEAAIRQSILETHAENLRARFPEAAMRPVASTLQAVPEGTRRRYAAVATDVRPAAARREYAALVGQTEKWIAAQAEASPRFRTWLMDGVAKFRQPATAWDMASNLLGEGLSRSFAQALPDPAGASSFSRQAANAGRAGLSAASQRLLRLSLNDFLKTQTRNVPYASAIGRVQSGAVTGLPFRHDEAVAIRNMADRIAADRQKIRVAMNDNAPGLVMKASRTEQIAAHNAVQILRQRASAEQMPGIARRVEGSLGDFEYHFPAQARSAAQAAQAGGLTELAQATATGVEMAANGPSPRTSGRSSRSFRMMRASFRAGGVVIGADPVALDRLDYEMLEWQREGSRLRLAIIDGAGTRIELGSYGGAMIQQALAYAADGRPMTVTMTDSPLTMGLLPTDEGLRPSMILKVHLHPALVNTELGCRLIELDRFTDEATGRWEERAKWQQAVKLQLMFYRAAAYNELDGFMQSFVKSGMNASSFVTTAFAPLNNVDDPRQSIFAAHPRRFDPGLSRMLKKCSADPASFVTCASNFPYDPMNYPVPEAWEVWSGVRERDFELRRTSFPAIVDPAGSPHPLRFMLQVAFNDSAPADENCAPGQCASDAESPWEFPMIAGELDRRVRDNVKASASDSAILAEAAEFTVLQRLFRAALKGELGPRFERAGLIKLMKDAAAAEPITYSPTPQWSQGRLGAELMALAAERAPERVADYYDTPAEAEAARAYLAALLAPGAGAKFADEARCR